MQARVNFVAPINAESFQSPLTRFSKCKASQRGARPRVWQTPRAEMVHVSVPIRIEAPSDHCYNLFSDLSLMPEWSSTLQSVERDPEDPDYSTWKFSWSGISLSWRARDIDSDTNDERAIRWRSVSGLPHVGCVSFTSESDTGAEDAATTKVVFSVDYDIAALVAVVMQSSFVSSFVENALRSDLQNFRSFALRKLRTKRMKSSSWWSDMLL